jgi:hypothetical protein
MKLGDASSEKVIGKQFWAIRLSAIHLSAIRHCDRFGRLKEIALQFA